MRVCLNRIDTIPYCLLRAEKIRKLPCCQLTFANVMQRCQVVAVAVAVAVAAAAAKLEFKTRIK